ncbi:MAG: ABC transporter permease [Phycisphaerales bacterium]|nr:MAG: ABC transporter permease [Phycisphaerales bacterium]
MGTLVQDFRYATRVLAKRPGITLVVVLTLGLGIGVNTAVFSVVHGVLLQPLPYQDPEELAVLWSHFPGWGVYEGPFSRGMYFEIEDRTHVFDQVAMVKTHSFTLTDQGPPERIRGIRASALCLSMLGARPTLGRLFASGEDEPGKPRTMVLSHDLWERRFGADPAVIGRVLQLDGKDYAVIGVLAEGFPTTRTYLPMLFDPSARIDYWIPLVLRAEDRQEHSRQNYHILARLASGVTTADAKAEMDLLAGRMKREVPQRYPPESGFAIDVMPLLDPMVREVRPALRLLAGAAGLVLLIACANVANLLLARATTRHREIGMRMVLGASRLRIVGQLLTESVLLSLLGGAFGLLIAWWGTSAFLAIGARTIPRIGEIGIDTSVVAFAFVLSVLTGVVFGLAPAWTTSRVDLNKTLRQAGQNLIGAASLWRQRYSARRLLVVAELGLSAVLLICAGLLIHSFYRLQTVDPGFSPENVLSFQLPENHNYKKDMGTYLDFYDRLRERIAGLPGVESVGGTSVLPLAPGESFAAVSVEGYVPTHDEAELKADSRSALWDYFQTMKIPLVAGRYFNEHDTTDSLRVAIVDETFAKRAWPNEDPIGKRIKDPAFGQRLPWLTVVGVVGAVKRSDLESDPRMTYYQPYSQWGSQWMYVVVRTSSDPAALVNAIADEVSVLDEDRPLLRVATMEQRVSDTLARRRFSVLLLGVFAASALVLAVVGLYAVLAHMVCQGTHEIGIRMALGARQSDVLRLVLWRGLTLIGIGLGIGLALSVAGTRVLANLLYEITPADPITFGSVLLVLGGVALLACYIPARRAAKVDPMVALRYE